MLSICGKTRILGIFGDPVAHSMSPAMQNAALAAAGIDAIYLPLPVQRENLESAVAAIRTFSMIGVNVTVPHKETIIPYLDELDPEAALIGAVNTVVNHRGRLLGFNTDAPGFLASLRQDLGVDPKGRRVVVLGAGGACRAALAALAGSGAAHIVVANRTPAKAAALVRELSVHFKDPAFEATALTEDAIGPQLQQAEILINTTAVGLAGEAFPGFVVDALPAGAAVYDMVYGLNLAPLLVAAQRRGLAFADGRGMLVAQGEAAFFRWFGTAPPNGVMRAQVIEK